MPTQRAFLNSGYRHEKSFRPHRKNSGFVIGLKQFSQNPTVWKGDFGRKCGQRKTIGRHYSRLRIESVAVFIRIATVKWSGEPLAPSIHTSDLHHRAFFHVVSDKFSYDEGSLKKSRTMNIDRLALRIDLVSIRVTLDSLRI